MLREARLTNFKAARNLEVPMAELTVLTGKNGSGKSTLLQCLAALRQSYLFGSGDGLLLRGPLAQLGSSSDVLSEGAKDELLCISLIEDGEEFGWKCKAPPDTDELTFVEKPPHPCAALVAAEFQYLQADRIVPQTLYPQADHKSRASGYLGTRGEFTADFLARSLDTTVPDRRQCSQDKDLLSETLWASIAPTAKLSDQVAAWLQHISPGVHLAAERIGGTDEARIQFRYYGASGGRSNNYRPTNVGFGITYSLPIIVACLSARRGSLLMIENPEAHLHPQGQLGMGALLSKCASDGVQLLVETHSDHLLNGIRLAAKHRTLPNEAVKICYFAREMSSGDSFVQIPSLLPDGQLSNWPDGFFDQWEKSLDALLR
jgi:predicted ATPase